MRMIIRYYKDPIMNQLVFHGMSAKGFVERWSVEVWGVLW